MATKLDMIFIKVSWAFNHFNNISNAQITQLKMFNKITQNLSALHGINISPITHASLPTLNSQHDGVHIPLMMSPFNSCCGTEGVAKIWWTWASIHWAVWSLTIRTCFLCRFRKASANERGCYICNIFSHWLRASSNISRKRCPDLMKSWRCGIIYNFSIALIYFCTLKLFCRVKLFCMINMGKTIKFIKWLINIIVHYHCMNLSQHEIQPCSII